ncbi:DUF4062 domain-containing protein [Subtercola lobariae]|uniref:DUF4062 domain-containing protein n=1 Tax=Subtercola lobariae TaxID=1588641 RepID=UPI00166702A0
MPTSLLIDQRSASPAVDEAQLHAWAAGRRVFVSSLIRDMPNERASVRDAIESVGAIPILFEDIGAQDISAEEAYLSGVRSSDVYVGLFGARYGVRMQDGYSATHAEFLEAERQGLRLCLFVSSQDSSQMDGSQRDLIQGAQNLYTTSGWSDSDDLRRRVRRRLTELAADELSPWVRVGPTIFRAHEITNDGNAIGISAAVRSNAIHSELMGMRDGRAGSIAFASLTDARAVRFEGLSTRTTTTIIHEEQLQLRGDQSSSPTMRASMSGISADEIARRALVDGLFGTSTLGDASWGTRPTDPLEPIRTMGLDDSVLRPVARLLITEHLLGTGSAATVDSFALGPAHQRVRRLRISWTPRQPHVNQPRPEPLTIDGRISGL